MLIIYAIQVDDELYTALMTALDIYSSTGMQPCEMFCSDASYEFNALDARKAIESDEALEAYKQKYALPLEAEKPHDIVAELYWELKIAFDELCVARKITTHEDKKEFYRGLSLLTLDNPAKIKQIVDTMLQWELAAKSKS